MAKGGLILNSECISRVIKFDSKKKKKKTQLLSLDQTGNHVVKVESNRILPVNPPGVFSGIS
jgi:hypothetical protein